MENQCPGSFLVLGGLFGSYANATELCYNSGMFETSPNDTMCNSMALYTTTIEPQVHTYSNATGVCRGLVTDYYSTAHTLLVINCSRICTYLYY